MPIAVTCSSCGARLKVADRLDGRTTACPRCRTILLVRRPAPPKPAPAPPPQSAPPPPADVEDLAAALLTGVDGGARQAPGAALPEGVARASREAERLIRLMLDCAGKGKDQTVYLLTFDLLKEINRRAADGSLTERKAHELWQRYVHDGGGPSFVGNFLVVGAAYVPAGSTLTLQEGYDLFRKRLL